MTRDLHNKKEYDKQYSKTAKAKRYKASWQKEFRAANKQLCKEQNKVYRKNNPILIRYNLIKSRAKRKGLEFNLDLNDLPLNPVCPVYGTRLTYDPDEKNTRLKASVDRVENTKGYIKGNISIISVAANSRKRDMSIKEVENLLAYLKGNLN